MNQLPEPLAEVLQSYCHVEWLELNELAEDVRCRRRAFDVDALKGQLAQLIAAHHIPYAAINKLTLNEFSSTDEARQWLRGIYDVVFSQQA